MSIASAQAAEARRRAAATVGYYNLKVGPTGWRFSSGLGVDYNSNVNYTEENPEGDFIFRPEVRTRMIWPISEKNSINLAFGGGYSAYVKYSNLDRFFILPGSELSFDVYSGDFWINLHDRFSITEYSYQDPTVAGSGNYSQLENAVGPSVVWDLNKGIAKVGYDHVNFDSLTGSGSQNSNQRPSGYSEVFSASVGTFLKPQMLLGLEGGGSIITYTTPTTNTPYTSADQWNVGGFYDTPVTEYIHFTGHAGYTVYTPQAGSGVATGDFTGMYALADITHRLNQYVSYTLTGGRDIQVAFWGGTVDRYYAHLRADWKIVEDVRLGTSFNYEHGSYLTSGGEVYNQYGPEISLSRLLTEKLTGRLSYRVYWRDSDQPGRNYTVNIVSANLEYRF